MKADTTTSAYSRKIVLLPNVWGSEKAQVVCIYFNWIPSLEAKAKHEPVSLQFSLCMSNLSDPTTHKRIGSQCESGTIIQAQ